MKAGKRGLLEERGVVAGTTRNRQRGDHMRLDLSQPMLDRCRAFKRKVTAYGMEYIRRWHYRRVNPETPFTHRDLSVEASDGGNDWGRHVAIERRGEDLVLCRNRKTIDVDLQTSTKERLRNQRGSDH